MLTRQHRAQAMVELTLGMFALALVTSALCLFAIYIARTLRVQNSTRGPSPAKYSSVKVDDFAAKYFVGDSSLKINEQAVMPSTYILNRNEK